MISVVVDDVGDYGAQVTSLDGIRGSIDWLEFSWSSLDLRSPKELVKVGQEIQILVIGFWTQEIGFSGSIRQLNQDENPWVGPSAPEVGKIFEGTVWRVCEWGVCLKYPGGIRAICVFSSEFPKNSVVVGEVVTAVVEKIEVGRLGEVERAVGDIRAKPISAIG